MIPWLIEHGATVYAVIGVLSVAGLFYLRKRPQPGLDISKAERRWREGRR